MSVEAEKKEDRRVRRTKKLMSQTLFKLMQVKPLKEITVRELTEACDINRGTFYMYYRDIFDMMDQIENEMFERFDSIIEEQGSNIEALDAYPVLHALAAFAEEHRDMCRVLLSPNGDLRFLLRLNSVVQNKCRSYWHSLYEKVPPEDFELGYAFVTYGCIGMLRAWVMNDRPVPAEQLAHAADIMLRNGALELIERTSAEGRKV